MTDHYEGKDALGHLMDARRRGHLAGHEAHGIEPSGVKNALVDSAKWCAVLLPFLSLIFFHLNIEIEKQLVFMGIFSFGLALWQFGRASFLGWARLEKLHRVTLQEKYEIEHNREQEKTELKEIYALKGFKDPLLDEVVNVLMQDDNRLLQVMLDEELGVSAFCQEHPLYQGFGAFCGNIIAAFIALFFTYFYGWTGTLVSCLVISLASAYFFARHQNNRASPSVVWQVALFALSYGSVYFLFEIFLK
jgi:hypothetical protein